MTRRSAALLLLLAPLVWPSPAGAHPLGNFTVNVYTGIMVEPERLALDLVVDMAEIPALQARDDIDTDGDGQIEETEAGHYAAAACGDAARQVEVVVGGRAVGLESHTAGVTFPPGMAGLVTLRLTCALTADTGMLSGDDDVVVRNRYLGDRVGWREMAAVGDRTTLVTSDVPRRSISDRLASYPDELLQSPPDQRSASLRVRPGGPPAPDDFGPQGVRSPSPRGVDRATQWFTGLVGRQRLTPGFAMGALAASIGLGALHALAPGHGKTVMAAYLVGERGSLRQAALIGLTVTLTHTAGVLVLGVVLSTATSLAPEAAYPWLELASGALLVAIGGGLLRRGVRRRSPRAPAGPDRGHHHRSDDHHHHGHSDGHRHGVVASRRELVAVGLAGGLVPTPSALVVLLGAIALGRAWFGVLLVVGYGIGMAGVLTGAGLVLVKVRAVAERRRRSFGDGGLARVAASLPLVTAALVLGGGVLLTLRALGRL